MATCSNCGKLIKDNAKFCDECGAAVGSKTVVQQTVTVKPPKAKKRSILTGFFTIFLFILAIVDYNSDPPIFTIFLSVFIIAGALFCSWKKYRLRLFSGIALIIAIVCIIAANSQAKQFGCFKIPKESDYTSGKTQVSTKDTSTTTKWEQSKNEEPVVPKDDKNTPAVTESEVDDAPNVEEDPEETVPDVTPEPVATPELVSTPEPTATPQPKETQAPVNGVNPELKAFLDSYEAFMDEYVAFMKKYQSDTGNAFTMLGDYMKFLDRADDFAQKADAYDESEMSDADFKYYMDTMNRINQKMLTAY